LSGVHGRSARRNSHDGDFDGIFMTGFGARQAFPIGFGTRDRGAWRRFDQVISYDRDFHISARKKKRRHRERLKVAAIMTSRFKRRQAMVCGNDWISRGIDLLFRV
jgi:hypothetical protein